MRTDPAYQRKLDRAKEKLEAEQAVYEAEFQVAVEAFLDFAPVYAQLGKGISYLITEQTIDVGSGTVQEMADWVEYLTASALSKLGLTK